MPRQDERDLVTLRDLEVRDGGDVLAPEFDRRGQGQRIGTRHRPEASGVVSRHPRHHPPVVEPDGEVHPHGHAPTHALHHADEIRVVPALDAARRHGVDDSDGAAVALELGLEHERPGAISPADGLGVPGWGE